MKRITSLLFFGLLTAGATAQAQLAITEIMTSEANTSNHVAFVSTIKYPDWFELSNYGTNDINLTGYRWNDDAHGGALSGDFAAFNGVIIHAGETIELVESNNVITSPAAFRQWWGLDPSAQVILLSGSDPGLSGSGDSVRLWGPGSASATEQFDLANLVDRVDTGAAIAGRSQVYFTNGTFAVSSTNALLGAFNSPQTDDVGSPGFHSPASPIVIVQQPSPATYTSPAGIPVNITIKGIGLPKPRFQWLFNGLPIDTNALGAGILVSITNNQSLSTLTFSSVGTNAAGTYSVIADNGVETLTSSNAVLTVTTTASSPAIITPPSNISAYVGQSVRFTVDASGSPSPTYQWKLNGTNIGGQISSQLFLFVSDTNVAGTYSVGITNTSGFTNASATLTVTAKPNLRITEVMPTEASGPGSHGDWWELSNLGGFPVNLQGYRFDDNSFSLQEALTITNNITIAPGESVVFVENMTPSEFRKWWGTDRLPANLQIVSYHGGGIGLSGTLGDTLQVWNGATETESDYLDAVGFDVQTNAISFGFDPETAIFGAETVNGINGGTLAAVNADLGSPGTIVNLPRFTSIAQTNGGFGLSWVSQPNRHYLVQSKGSLGDSNWITITNGLPSDANLLRFVDPANVSTQRFYRVILNP